MKFDETKFIEGFAVIVLGSAAHDYLNGSSGQPADNFETVRKFQKSLHLAAEMHGFTEDVATRYLGRIAELTTDGKKEYLEQTLQPSVQNFDKQKTSIVIFDHVLRPDIEWKNLAGTFRARAPIQKPQGANSAGAISDLINKEHAALMERREIMRRSGLWGRFKAWLYDLL